MNPLAILVLLAALILAGCKEPNPKSRKQQITEWDKEHPGIEGGGLNSP